ncbi:carboxypeptidase-like regulatory domain-containing protein [Rufibacter ruber]|uniref:carboxypeptidase-like regulatory domain-containing protein n=1 Tax=Rufibacter ruber TaxID=1783499 RepID=UPI000835F55C|nr:carboxypeptidase-like regulatory domain-containing protein [Rufibacter ruber]
MMKRLSFLVFLFCSLLPLLALQAQTNRHNVWVSGQVLQAKDKTPVAGASVYQKSTGAGVATDDQGRFRVQMPASDTLVFKALGYKQKVYVPALRSVTELRTNILLEEESVQLQEVRVSQLSQEKVDRVLRNMKPRPPAPKPRMNPMVPRIIIPPSPPEDPAIFSSPLSFLYDQFSKEGKQRRRLSQLKEERDRQKAAERAILRQDSLRQARLRYNRLFKDTTSFYDPRW